MIRIAPTLAALALAAGLFVTADPLRAQSFQTALPLDPSERRAMEAELPRILEFAPEGDITRVPLPSGRILAVRPYRPVRRPGEAPCRGYRIDLFGSGDPVAVDGFRCRRSDGAGWLIVEPEIVLAQGSGPLDLTGTVSPSETDEPFALGTPAPPAAIGEAPRQSGSAFFSPGEVPPVPRPAPRSDVAAATQAPAPAVPAVIIPTPAGPATIDTGPLEEVAEEVAGAPLAPLAPLGVDPSAPLTTLPGAVEGTIERITDEATTTTLLPREVTPPAPSALTGVERVEVPAPAAPDSVVAAIEPPTDPNGTRTRVVGGRVEASAAGFTGNPRILGALRELAYIGGEATPTAGMVQEAIDAFARDERFALPVSSDSLMSRLDAAVARSDGLPACASAPAGVPCLE